MENIYEINFNKRAIENWRSFSVAEKDYWRSFLNLQDCSIDNLKRFNNYRHNYNYKLDNEKIAELAFCCVVEILRYNLANKMTNIFIANSGGLDSAVVGGLLSRAMKLSKKYEIPLEVTSFGLPIESNPEHNIRAMEVAERFGLRHITIGGLDKVFYGFKDTLQFLIDDLKFNNEQARRAFGNVKARIRMIVNFFGTTKPGSYVISTDNLSELYMAFWTLMGDVGVFAPIQYVLKGLEEPYLAHALNVPESILLAKPTDGLSVHTSLDNEEGGDTDAFRGVYYPHLDAIICHAVKNGLKLDESQYVFVDSKSIDCSVATQETVDYLIKQMISPSSVWKRVSGSIGKSISREDLGLPELGLVATKILL